MAAPRRWHEQDLVLKDFSGGENSQDSPIKLLPNELSDCQNVLGDKRGALRRRKGITKYNAVAVPDGAIPAITLLNGFTKFYDSVDGDVVIAMQYGSGKLYRVPATGASVDLGLDHDGNANFNYAPLGYFTRFQQYRNRLYGVPQGLAPFVIAPNPSGNDNLLAWAMGVTVPTAVVTLAEDGAGNVDGTVSYMQAYFYGEDGAHGESNPCETVAEITTSSKKITVTLLGAGKDYADWDEAHDAGIDKIRVYRTEDYGAGDPGTYYYVGDVTSGLVYSDNTTDADLDDTTLPQSDNYSTPATPRFVCLHGERMFFGHLGTGNTRRVSWSLAGSPDICPANNYADAPAEHGEITGLRVIAGQLYVFFKSAIARLTVHGGSDNSFEIVTSVAGCWAAPSLVVGEELSREVAFFVASDGQVYVFDGTAVRVISTDQRDAIFSDMEYSSPNSYGGGWDGRFYHLRLDAGTTLLRYDTVIRKQVPGDACSVGTWWPEASVLYHSSYVRFEGGSDGGALFMSTKAGLGFLYEIDSGDDDDGDDITYHFYTGYLDCGDGGLEKYFDSMMIDSESDTALTVTWDTDWDTATNTFDTTTGTNAVRSYHDPSGRTDFRHIRIKVEGEDGDDPSTVYALILRVGAARPARKTT